MSCRVIFMLRPAMAKVALLGSKPPLDGQALHSPRVLIHPRFRHVQHFGGFTLKIRSTTRTQDIQIFRKTKRPLFLPPPG